MRRRPTWKGFEVESKLYQARKKEEGEGDATADLCVHLSNTHISKPRLPLSAIKSLMDFRRTALFHDAVLHLDDGTRVPVHKAILSAASPYFRTMFTTTLTPSEKRDFQMFNMSYKTLNHILDFAYSGMINVNDDNVFEVFKAADFMAIGKVLRQCCEFLKGTVTSVNCFGVLKFARQYKDELGKDLALYAYRFIMDNFAYVALESDELLTLSLEEFKLVLRADDLIVRNEQVVWESIIRWIDFNIYTRKQHLIELMNCIRFGMMDTEFFIEHVKNHPWVEADGKNKPYVVEILTKLYDLDHTKLMKKPGMIDQCEFSRPRVPDEIILAIGGWSGGNATNCIEAYDTKADMWVVVPSVDKQGPRAYHGTAVLGTDVFVIGGFDGHDQYYNSCRCFDAVTKEWREIAPMNCRRCYVSVAVIGETIYAMGGYDGLFRRNTAERYNERLNQWTMIAPMNVQRSDAGATTYDGRIYISGGFDGAFCLNSAEVYDPGSNQWTMIAPMRGKRSGVSCIEYHGFIYAMGGFNGTARMNSCEKYCPCTNTWVKIPPMYTPRSNFGIAVLEDMIFSIGGFNGVTTVFRVECYDDFTNQWYEAQDMHMYRSAVSACVLQGLPNMIDYIYMPEKRIDEERKNKLLWLQDDKNNVNT